MSKVYPEIDPNGLAEYSVVYTDRSLNHMSQAFQKVMREISGTLKAVYNGEESLLIPGGGTIGMEAIARQFAHKKNCLILRNGWFSYRWSQIFEAGQIPLSQQSLLARPLSSSASSGFAPAPLNEILDEIRRTKPDLFFAAHVETASGMLIPDEWLLAIGEELKSYGGLFVLDCIASGALWVDMQRFRVDILLSAPQKSWSSSPCAALVVLSNLAAARMRETTSSSFAVDMNKWRQIMKAYEDGGHAYHATLPTDSLARFHGAMREMEGIGFERLKTLQLRLGQEVRNLLAEYGVKSVAAKGFEAPTVVVSYTDQEAVQKGAAFIKAGLQVAAGVPLACGEGDKFASFRIGLFGLDKLMNIDRTVATLKSGLDQVGIKN